MIFGMLDFSLMDYMAVEDFFTEHVFLVGKPNFGPLLEIPKAWTTLRNVFVFVTWFLDACPT